MAGLWDSMNTFQAGLQDINRYMGKSVPAAYQDKTQQYQSRLGGLLDTVLSRIGDAGNTTTTNTAQTGSQATTSAQQQQQTIGETNLQETLSNLMSQMSGAQPGQQAGQSQQQQIIDMVSSVTGDKSDERYAGGLERMAELTLTSS